MLDRLQAAFEAQRAFVRNASHEIRNPLTAIIGEADLVLSKDRSSGEYRQALFAIQKEAQRLEDLTRQLLDLEKAEALTSLSELEEVPLHLCLLETLSNFSSARIQLTLPENKQEFLVPGSLALLQTALNNLIDNALKYSGDKPIQVELSEESDWYRILVADQGIGIPANEMPNIYQPLHRGANARIAPGHGIGLPLAKKIIELHKGTIEISSTSGVGTLATVLLPKLS
jgi:signal transduction histidine kinase